ncbi:hypothetical protein EBH_0039900 [Eimeria brunetti]|uniref:Uncharacterized protein n=1 Tax=Eimeria brunetti TaxID=51314 RepID=U6LHD4_9EIME|nr:hypothetical protein EBH_0039900 [Eimeria brunetti]
MQHLQNNKKGRQHGAAGYPPTALDKVLGKGPDETSVEAGPDTIDREEDQPSGQVGQHKATEGPLHRAGSNPAVVQRLGQIQTHVRRVVQQQHHLHSHHHRAPAAAAAANAAAAAAASAAAANANAAANASAYCKMQNMQQEGGAGAGQASGREERKSSSCSRSSRS